VCAACRRWRKKWWTTERLVCRDVHNASLLASHTLSPPHTIMAHETRVTLSASATLTHLLTRSRTQ
jgi:hypothetical protein